MIIPITLSGRVDKDLISISLDERFDTPNIFSSAVKSFVRRENTVFCTVPKQTNLYYNNCKIELKLYFHDEKDADVIDYLRLIPKGARGEILKQIIRKMISKECYYSLFNFGDFFDTNPPSIELECSFEQLKQDLSENLCAIKMLIEDIKSEKEGLQVIRNLSDSNKKQGG